MDDLHIFYLNTPLDHHHSCHPSSRENLSGTDLLFYYMFVDCGGPISPLDFWFHQSCHPSSKESLSCLGFISHFIASFMHVEYLYIYVHLTTSHLQSIHYSLSSSSVGKKLSGIHLTFYCIIYACGIPIHICTSDNISLAINPLLS